VLLTTGMQLGSSAEEDRHFLCELIGTGVTAMGLALDVIHGSVPEHLLNAATELDFPIFTVPLATPFRDVTGHVLRAVSSEEIRASHRLIAMQRFLMEAMSDDVPKDGLLRRLASFLDAHVGLSAADGRLEFESASMPWEAITSMIDETGVPPRILELRLPGLHGLAVPVNVEDGFAQSWLTLAWPEHREIPVLAKPAAYVALPLLEAITRLARAELAERREVRRAALEALIDPGRFDDARILNGRCRAYGLDLTAGVCAVAIADDPNAAVADTLDACEIALERAHVPFLATQHGDKVVVLVQASVADECADRHLLAGAETLRAGIGRAVFDGHGIAHSWADAELAAEGRIHRGRSRIVRYDDLDLGTILLHEIPVDRLGPKIDQLLTPLRENPLMYVALTTYLRLNQDVGRTARALKLHPNSVRYRLARAEKILGLSLRSSATIFALHVALVLEGSTEEASVERPVLADVA
jgi:DNA-binding PucR family transcriptional regulator